MPEDEPHLLRSSEEASENRYYVPARYTLTFLTFWGLSLEFAHRVCFSITVVAMVNHTSAFHFNSSNDSLQDDGTCPMINLNTSDIETGTYNWSPSTQGMILGSYFYGYLVTLLGGGRLAELYGGKWLLGLAILFGSILTLLTPMAADMGVPVIVCLRIAMGLMHGLCLPTVFAMFHEWAPEKEKSGLVALCVVGDQVGTVLSMPLSGYLCEHGFAGGWPSVFYVLGCLGVLWFIIWCCLVYSVPSDHPRISKEELDYIQEGKRQKCQVQKVPIPWMKIITSAPVWSLVVVLFASFWGHVTLLTKLPTYLQVILHVPIKKNGLLNSLVYVGTSVTLLTTGYLSDYLILKWRWSPTKVRKVFQAFAMLGPAICTALIPHVKCNRAAVIILLALSMALLGFCGGGHVSIAVDMAPNYAGTIYGFANSIGCTAGILSPLIAGFILDSEHDKLLHWNEVFYISSAMYLAAWTVFTICASADLQSWSRDSKTYLNTESPSINFTRSLEASLKYGSIS